MITATSNVKAYQAPTLWVTIGELRVPVAVPTLDLVEKFLAKAQKVAELKDGLTLTAYDDIFEFFAELMSCNHNYLRFTPEDLKKTNITVDQIVGVLSDWAKFITDIAELKN